MITPQLKCDCRCVSKEGAEKVLADELALCAPPLSPVLLQKIIIIPWSRSHLADVSQLEAVKTIILCKFVLCPDENDHTHTRTASCGEEEFFFL